MTVSYALRFLAAALLALCAAQARAAITCNLNATSLNLNYVSSADTNGSGNVTLNCTRVSGDPTSTTYFISINNGSTGTRRVYRHGGATGTASDRLNFTLTDPSSGNNWSTGGSRVTGTLNFGAGFSASVTLPYTFFIGNGLNGKSAGIYDNVMTASLQLTTAGAVVATTVFTPTVSIVAQCFVGQVASGLTAAGAVSPSTLTLNYPSFSGTAGTATMGFTVDCTLGTTYSLALAPASGTLLGLSYTLSLTPAGASVVGSGLADSYTVTGSIAAGQAGTCATATCSATQVTTVTITY